LRVSIHSNMANLDGFTHYEVLDLQKHAMPAEIRKAYRLKALKHHPDKDASEHATALFQRILQAYEVLSSPRQRLLYDVGDTHRMRNEAAKQRAAKDRDLRRSILKDRLIEASKSGNAFEAMKLLRGGAMASDLNTLDELGRTPLIYAAESGHTQVVSLIILYQADVNVTDSQGWSPIMFAVTAAHGLQDDVSCLSALLRAKAQPDTKACSGVTALLLACVSGSLPMVQSLLDYGADANIAGQDGVAPLALASDSGHVEVVSALLSASASVDMADRSGRTALMSASALANVDLVAMLLKAGADPCAKTVDGRTALLYAADYLDSECSACPDEDSKQACVSVARMLLASRADPKACVADGSTPLRIAELACNGAVVAALLGKPAEPASQDSACAAGGA